MDDSADDQGQQNRISEGSRFRGAMFVLSPVWITLVGVLIFAISILLKEPERTRVHALREATCSAHGMVLLDDKYHDTACAFFMDATGKRID